MTRRKKPIEYKVSAEFYGLRAYIADKLVEAGLYKNREDVLDSIVSRGIEALSTSGLLGRIEDIKRDAAKKGYIPIKIPDKNEK